jgi:hypothetical protein
VARLRHCRHDLRIWWVKRSRLSKTQGEGTRLSRFRYNKWIVSRMLHCVMYMTNE